MRRLWVQVWLWGTVACTGEGTPPAPPPAPAVVSPQSEAPSSAESAAAEVGPSHPVEIAHGSGKGDGDGRGQGDGPPGLPRSLEVRLESGETRSLDATTLASLERTADPRGRLQGWDLVDVLHLATNGATIAGVRVAHRDPKTPPVELGPPEHSEHFFIVKHASSGDLRLQQWAVGTEKVEPLAVHRDIAHLDVRVDPDTERAQR